MSPKLLSKADLLEKLPISVTKIFSIFGKEIRLVGGSVRDLLLNIEVNDFDFATTFTPVETKEILKKNNIKYVDLAEKFGTIIAVIDGQNFEITTLRQEYEYNGRHCLVKFSSDFFEDAKRRDFTINAFYLDQDGVIYDYFDGISDLWHKKVKFIGDANLRIKEDYLRILRFFRFSARFCQEINYQNLEACIKQQKNLLKLSKSRIREEFLKIIQISDFQNLYNILKILQDNNFFKILFSKNLQLENFIKLNDLSKKISFNPSLNLKIATLILSQDLDLKKLKQDLCLARSEYRYFNFFLINLDSKFGDDEFFEFIAINNDCSLIAEFYIFWQLVTKKSIEINKIKQILDFLEKYMIAKFPIDGKEILQLGFKDKDVGKILRDSKVAWLKSGLSLDKKDILNLIAS